MTTSKIQFHLRVTLLTKKECKGERETQAESAESVQSPITKFIHDQKLADCAGEKKGAKEFISVVTVPNQRIFASNKLSGDPKDSLLHRYT